MNGLCQKINNFDPPWNTRGFCFGFALYYDVEQESHPAEQDIKFNRGSDYFFWGGQEEYSD